MKRVFLFMLMFVSTVSFSTPTETFSYSSLAPKKKKSSKFDKSRILLGPGLGFGAAYRAFSFNISPSVAYCFTDNFHAGATLGFNYFQFSEDYTNPVTNLPDVYKQKYSAYSLSLYARYLLANFLIINFEPEINNTKFVNSISYNQSTGKIIEKSSRLFVPSVLVGAGYAQRFSEYAHSYFMVCYDLVQNPNARYYQTLDYRVGIMISLWN